MRVAPHELVVDAVGDVGDRESAFLLGDRGVELDLVEQVAEFLDQVGIGVAVGVGIAVACRNPCSVSPLGAVLIAWMASTTS